MAGLRGIRDLNALKSALAQPKMTFDGIELYSTVVKKAAAIGFSLIKNHPFIDGNKRVGQAAMEIFLVLNGFEIVASIDDQEQMIMQVASAQAKRDDLEDWLDSHVIGKK